MLFLLHPSHCCYPLPSSLPLPSIYTPTILLSFLHCVCNPPPSFLTPTCNHPSSLTSPSLYTLFVTSVTVSPTLFFFPSNVRLLSLPPYFHLSSTSASLSLDFKYHWNIYTHIHTHAHTRSQCNRAEEKTKHLPTDDLRLYKCFAGFLDICCLFSLLFYTDYKIRKLMWTEATNYLLTARLNLVSYFI